MGRNLKALDAMIDKILSDSHTVTTQKERKDFCYTKKKEKNTHNRGECHRHKSIRGNNTQCDIYSTIPFRWNSK